MANANEDSVRVHPWATYVLSAILLGASLFVLFTTPDTQEQASESPEIQAAVRYFERNPEVDVSARFAPYIGTERMAEVRAGHEKRRKLGGVAVLSPRMLKKTQKRFDDAQRKAFASLHDLPSFRFGIVDGTSSFTNTFTHLAVNETALAVGISVLFFALAALCLEGAWGSLLLGGLVLLLSVVTRTTYTTLYGDLGVPWIGASGLVAGLLGAYLVRSFQGFTIPGWLVLPVWIICEYLLARDLPIDHFDATPLVMHGIALAFGAGVAGAIWVLELEDKLYDRQRDTPDLVSNSVLEEALQHRDHGDVEAAFDLLDGEVRRAPGNHDAAVALWQLASESGLAERAMPGLLGAIRDALRANRHEEACSLWTSVSSERQPQAEGTLLVRMGESLLTQEEHEAALQAFGWAVNGPKPLSSVLAMRVVRGSKDLDSELASRAAALALIDDQLGASERAAMQKAVDAGQARAAAATDAAPIAAPSTGVAPGAASAEEAAAPPLAAPAAAADPDPYQDPHAIAADTFQELGEGESLAGEDPDAWNDPSMVEDLSGELEDESAGFDWSGLQDEDAEAAEAAVGADTNVDLGDPEAAVADDSSETTDTTDTLDPARDDSPLEETTEPELDVPRRVLVSRSAVPVSLDDEGLMIEVEDGAKTRLPFSRIEAVGAGAVQGLADRPVLVVDLALNWLAVPDEPLKVVRFRSDQFDPRSVVPGRESALEALRAMLDQLIANSGATPLPGRDAALGNPFASFPDIASYDRDVLMAES